MTQKRPTQAPKRSPRSTNTGQSTAASSTDPRRPKFNTLTQKKGGHKLIFMSLALILCFFVWVTGLFAFAHDLKQEETLGQRYFQDAIKGKNADTIIVLTGGTMRIERGLELLEGEAADNLFISGVYKGTEVRELLDLWKKNKKDLNCCIHLGYEAEHTEGNAKEVSEWMLRNNYTSAYLITANYHMKRALFLFNQDDILQALDIYPIYVTPKDFDLQNWSKYKRTRKIVIDEYHKFLYARLKFFLINRGS